MLYLKNPVFIAYIHALVDLHVLLIRELDDSPEAEAIRDQTDSLWCNLTIEERQELGRISEFLYGIKII